LDRTPHDARVIEGTLRVREVPGLPVSDRITLIGVESTPALDQNSYERKKTLFEICFEKRLLRSRSLFKADEITI